MGDLTCREADYKANYLLLFIIFTIFHAVTPVELASIMCREPVFVIESDLSLLLCS